jgi:asparagine synthase (glutamine-hydrolysing)
MCGFLGYSSDPGTINKFYEDKFEIYHKRMFKRGPDFQKKIKLSGVRKMFNLGFSRLSIQDSNPRANKIFFNKRFALLFNGEIYNGDKLKKKYFNNHIFETKTDTEILFNILICFGISKLSEIEGIFAFVLIDFTKNIVYLTKDFTGTKPLYYSIINNDIFFSSEAWFLYSISKKEIDYNSLNFYLKFGFCQNEKTLINNVFKVSPNQTLIFNLNNNKIKEVNIFNNLGFSKNKELGELDSKELNNKVINIIKKNLIGFKKVGTFLSGGIDSSIISLETRKINPSIEAYTSIYKNFSDNNEDYYITKKLCKDFNIKLNVSEIELNSIGYNNFLQATSFFDEPVANLNFYSSYKQAEMAKKNGVSVILTGDGSDEIFCGYRKYLTYNLFEKLKYLSFLSEKLRKYNEQSKETFPSFFFRKFSNENIIKLFCKSISNEIINSNSHLIYEEKTNSNLANINYFDFKNWLSAEHNFKLDKSTMAHSVEARIPFQDINLVKHYNSNNIINKISLFKGKVNLRKSFSNLPSYVLNRKKSGWFLPEKVFLKDFIKFGFKNIFDKNNTIFLNNNLFLKKNSSDNLKKIETNEIISAIMLQIWYNNVIKS